MDINRLVIISVVTDEKELNISYTVGWSIEDLCIKV